MDFVPLNDGVVTFSPGSSSGDSTCIALDIIDDEIVETTQSFAVRIVGFSDNVNVPPDGETATVVILDDDGNLSVCIKKY